MPMKASDVVTDALQRIEGAIKDGAFDREELEAIIKICDKLKEITQRTIDKGPLRNDVNTVVGSSCDE